MKVILHALNIAKKNINTNEGGNIKH